jgi:hypothetical protein
MIMVGRGRTLLEAQRTSRMTSLTMSDQPGAGHALGGHNVPRDKVPEVLRGRDGIPVGLQTAGVSGGNPATADDSETRATM